MPIASNAADYLLLPHDSARALEKLSADVARFAELDPKVHKAVSLLEDRFDDLTEQEREIVGPLLWAYARGHIQYTNGLDDFRKRWITDGDAVLRAVEAGLEGFFSVAALKAVAAEAMQLTSTNSTAASEIGRARDEVEALTSRDILAPVFFLAGYGAGALYDNLVHWPTPPPPPPPQHLEAEHSTAHTH